MLLDSRISILKILVFSVVMLVAYRENFRDTVYRRKGTQVLGKCRNKSMCDVWFKRK